MDELKPLLVRLPEETKDRLKRAADEDRRSMSSQIVWIVQEWLREREKVGVA